MYLSEDDLDPGYILDASFGRYPSQLFALAFEGGFVAPDPDAPSTDLFAVPLMLNGRVSIPVWILEAYGDAGVVGVYYDIEIGPPDDDAWLLAGNAFLGADIAIFGKLTGGRELKH
jgi:hypothetical protein